MKNVDEWFVLNKQYEVYIVNKQSAFNRYCIHWTSASEQLMDNMDILFYQQWDKRIYIFIKQYG